MRDMIGMYRRKSEPGTGEKHRLHRRTALLHMAIASSSDTGCIRKNNEDALALCSPPTQALFSSLGQLVVLADGAGGHAAGEVASQVAVETISKVYYRPPALLQETMYPALEQSKMIRLHGLLEGETEVLTHLHHAFLAAHWRIRALAQEQRAYAGMITTCLAAVVKGSGAFIAHIGDSRAYVIGIVTGLGELLGYSLRLVSGRLNDQTQQFWPITIFGYIIQVAAVPLLALASNWPVAALLIILERVGKATRNPPRDVMLSHAAREMGYGWAFGVHEALDQCGALAGPLVVAAVLAMRGQYRLAFAVLLVPALLTLGILAIARFLYP